ncbi:hypothetical protein VTI74DRAFT_9277 [Chaetomium olivicolor]
MKTTSLLAVAATIVQTIHGFSIPERRDGLKVVGLETERRAPRNPVHRDKLRKRGIVSAGLDNQQTLYFVNATVGTPAKKVMLHLDTGSSDLWVNTPNSALCSSNNDPCKYAGTYSANSSSTYEYIGSYFNISYVDGSGATGDYVSDTVTIGGQKIDRLQFGIGYSSSNAQGILGIGYPINEVQVGRAKLKPYNNLPAQMVASNLIQSQAYSLWLNDIDASTGTILFGGVDTAKFTPPLQILPIESSSGVYAEFLVTLTKLQVNHKTIGGGNLALAVLLDTGSSLSYLPDSLVQEIYNAVGATYDPVSNAAYVPCSLARSSSAPNITFTFTSPSITVSMNSLVLDMGPGRTPTLNGAPACLFGIGPAGSGTSVLGDTFLRSAYVVYDLENNEIALAPTRFNVTASKVVEIGKGEGAVPDATRVSNPVRATEGLRGPNGQSEGMTAGAQGMAEFGALFRSAVVAVGVAVGVGVVVGL